MSQIVSDVPAIIKTDPGKIISDTLRQNVLNQMISRADLGFDGTDMHIRGTTNANNLYASCALPDMFSGSSCLQVHDVET